MRCPPGMCAGSPDCPDHHCPGRGMADQCSINPEQAQGWSATAGYWIVAVLAGIAFLLIVATVLKGT